MAETSQKPHPEIQPDIRPNLHPNSNNTPANTTSADLGRAEQSAGTQHGAASGGMESAPGNATNQNPVDSAGDLEDSENRFNFKNDSKDSKKKTPPTKQKMFKSAIQRSALAFVVVIILGPAGALLMFISNPLLSISENAFLSNDTRASFLERRLVKLLDRKIAHAHDKNISKSVTNIAERLNAFPNRLLLEMDKAGLKPIGAGDYSSGKGYSSKAPTHIELKDTGRRIPIGDFPKALAEDYKVKNTLTKSVRIRFKAHTGKFINRVFYKLLGIVKNGGVIGDADKHPKLSSVLEKAKAITNLKGGLKDASAIEERFKPLFTDVMEKQAKKAVKSGDPAIMAGSVGCLAVNAPRTIASIIRGILLGQAIVAASDILLSPGSKIKAGDATPEEGSAAASVLTETDENGKSALDSPVLQSALGINKEKVELGAWVAGFSFMSSKSVQASMAAGEATRPACNAIMSPAAFALAAAIAAGSAVTGPGAAAYAAIKAAVWTLIKFKGAEIAIESVVPLAAALATFLIAKTGLGSHLMELIQYGAKKGEDLGNYLGMALLSLFSDVGLKTAEAPLKPNQQEAFNKVVLEPSRIAYKQYVASTLSPFDLSSQYTFMGSIASKLRYGFDGQVELSGILTDILRIPSIAISSTTPAVAASAPVHDYSKECKFETLKVALNAACTPYVGMPVEFIDMPSDEAEKLVDKDAINQDATDITDVIDPDSEMAIKMSECSSGSIESLDGCVIETKSTGAGRLSPAEVKKQCSQMGDIENDQAAKDAYNNCVNALSKVSTKGQSLDARKNAADYIYNTDLQVESMLSGDDEEDIVGNSGAGSNFRVATLNARGASHTDGAGAEDHLANNNSASRIKFTQNVIQSNNFDIIGFQELEPVQSKYLDKNLTGFDHTEKGKGADRIMWNTSRFTKTDEGTWKSTYFRGPIDEPWVKLQDNNTGQELYVMNVHDPINKGHGSAATRYSNALKHLAQVKLLSQNAPVVFTGDFNQGYVKGTGAGALSDAKTTYCVLVGDGTMSDTYDIVAGRDSGCPDNPKPRAKSAAAQIDHIYVSAGLTATSFDAIPRGYTSNGSDHPTVFSDISIPGGSTTSGSGGDLVGDYKEPSYAAIPSITVNNAPTSCSGKFTKGASSLSGIIKSRWSIIKSIGGYSCRANTANPNELSVHASGRALDIMVDGTTPAGLKAGNDIRNFLIGNAEKLGIQRVIWNRHIWSANKNGWQKYTGPSPHIDHVHAEINIQASKNANLGK